MNEQKFFENLRHCVETNPTLAAHMKQALARTMSELAEKEDYEGACRYRDMIRFIDKRFLRGKNEENQACPCE